MFLKCLKRFIYIYFQLKRSRETESQVKPLVEKNRRLSKKNDDTLQTIQRMEEKIKGLSRENAEIVRSCSHNIYIYHPIA